MTVIAYKNKILAADTKAVGEDGLTYKSKKLEKLSNNTLIGCAGDSDCRDLVLILGKSTLNKMPTKVKLRSTETFFRGIWVFPTGEVFRVSVECEDSKWDAEILPVFEPQIAVGSGGAYALGAMLAGKTAIEAVKIACKLDNDCGLPVESMTIDT